MKMLIEKITYILLVLFSIYLGLISLESKFIYTGFFLIFVPTATIIYSFLIHFRNRESLPSLFVLHMVLAFFFFSGVDSWKSLDDAYETKNESSYNRKYFIPEKGHYLYPEKGFKELAILKDDFHGIKYDYQENLDFQDNTFQIYKGFQGGIYSYEAWLNIPIQGEIYLRAYDLLSNTELLSSERLKKASTLQVSDTGGKIQLFSLLAKENNPFFTIYEGGWGNYYGVRFELWYLPFSSGTLLPEKLLEDYYIVDGWER